MGIPVRFTSCLARFGAALVVTTLVALGSGADAQELEPRAYTNTPVGLNFLIAGYAYSSGGVATDPALPIKDAHLHIHSAILAYARSLNVLGTSGKVDVVLPYAWLSGSVEVVGQPREREVSGLADPRLRFSVNLYGAPALSVEEFTSYKQDLIVGASLQVGIPLGQYDSEKLVNLGTNRWSVKPALGISKACGRLTIEASGGITFYTTNDDFFGGKSRSQEPLYSLQGHLSYNFSRGMWVGLDGTYYTGGRTTTDGVQDNNFQGNTRVGVTFALPVNRYNSIKLYASTGVSTRTGGNFDTLGIAWQYRWGGGF
jgi:hypothetical protein